MDPLMMKGKDKDMALIDRMDNVTPSLINFQQNRSAGGLAGRGRQNQYPDTEYWINVGVEVSATDPETGEEKQVFISLPVGIPVNNWKEVRIPALTADNQEFRDLMIAKKQLAEQAEQILLSLQPGESKIVRALTAEFRRVKKKENITSNDIHNNQYLVNILD